MRTTLDTLITDPVAVISRSTWRAWRSSVLRGASRILGSDRPTVYLEAFNRAALRRTKTVLKPYGYRPTGAVFNSTPTYEFSTTAPASAPLRVVLYQATHAVRRNLWRIAKRTGIR